MYVRTLSTCQSNTSLKIFTKSLFSNLAQRPPIYWNRVEFNFPPKCHTYKQLLIWAYNVDTIVNAQSSQEIPTVIGNMVQFQHCTAAQEARLSASRSWCYPAVER